MHRPRPIRRPVITIQARILILVGGFALSVYAIAASLMISRCGCWP